MKVKHFLGIVEISTKAVSVVVLALAFVRAFALRGSLRIVEALLMALSALLVDMGTTAFNVYFDARRGTDDPNSWEADRVVARGEVKADAALLIALTLFAWAGALGIALSFSVGPWIIAAGAACLLVGFFYSGGPRPLSGTPIGEFFAGGFLGSVLFLITLYTQTGAISSADVLLSLPPALLIAAILSANNACDRVRDAETGRRTLAILLGESRARWLAPAWTILAYLCWAWLILGGLLASSAFIPLAAGAALSAAILVVMGRRGYGASTKGPSMKSILLVFIVSSVAYGVSILLPYGSA